MSSLKIALNSVPIAVTGWLASANASAIGGLTERTDAPASEIYSQVLRDEGLEHLWQFLSSSIITNLFKESGSKIPEQLILVPSKLLGSIWHWAISSPTSLNRTTGSNGNSNEKSFFQNFHDTILKTPSEYALKLCGLKGKNTNFAKYILSQIIVFSGATFLLRKNEDENLPGVNVEKDLSLKNNLFKMLGYSVAEQSTYLISQTTRFYMDFKDQFGKNAFAKSLYNVVNEKLIPGHFLSALAGSTSAYALEGILPRTTASVLGETPMKILNRIVNAHRRRVTKKARDENNKPINNFLFSNDTAQVFDTFFNPTRRYCLNLISRLFNVSQHDLIQSTEIKDEEVKIKQLKNKESDKKETAKT